MKALQMELDREREAGAAQASRLRAHLDDVQLQAGQEEQRLAERLALSQKEISRLEREMQDNLEAFKSSEKQIEQLKRELKMANTKPQESPTEKDDKGMTLEECKQILDKKSVENKDLRDKIDELDEQLKAVSFQAAQRSRSARKTDPANSSHSRIPMLRGSSLYHRLSISSLEMSETDEEDPFLPVNVFKPNAAEKMSSRMPSLSREISQIEKSDLLEKQRQSLQESHEKEIKCLEEQHSRKMNQMTQRFDQEKETLLEEQKRKSESQMTEKLKNMKSAFNKEKADLIHKHESEKGEITRKFEQEKKDLQTRLSKAESLANTSLSSRDRIQGLESQLSDCEDTIQRLENDVASLTDQMEEQKISLIDEFDDERRNLAERFSRELEQHQTNYRSHLDQLFTKGAEGLTGKLREDFLCLVRKHTEEEVGQSQKAILNQLQQDRNDIIASLEKERSEIYKEAENQKVNLMERYESQIVALNSEIQSLRNRLDEERKKTMEVAEKESDASLITIGSEVVNNLRKEMEEELVTELAKIKEAYDTEKKELETQKNLLEEELSETQTLLEAEKKNSVDRNDLEESVKLLRAEKREVEGMVEGMKEKLFLAYQQKGVNKSELENRYKEGRQDGLEEGMRQGKENGYIQGKQEGVEEGKALGLEEGRKEAVSNRDSSHSKQLQEAKNLIESLRQQKNDLENRLKQEKEKSSKCQLQAQDRDLLKHRFDQLLGEKHAIEEKHEEALAQILEDHQAEKEHLMEEIKKLEQRRIQAQSDQRAIEAHIGALHQELELAHQEIKEDKEETGDEAVLQSVQNQSVVQDQMTLLQYQLKEAETAQNELGLLKEEYESLLQEKCELEELVKKLRTKSFDEDQAKIKSQMEHIKTLTVEKNQMREILDETSDQLIKSTTSMALSQTKNVRDLETLKQKTSSMVEKENYTQLQISLVDQQKLVISLQDTLREREALVDKVIKEREEEISEINQLMETRVNDIQKKHDISQELLTKQRDKYKQLCNTSNRRNLLLKDMYVDYNNLKVKYADTDQQSRHFERRCRKLQNKCNKYKNTLSHLCQMLSR